MNRKNLLLMMVLFFTISITAQDTISKPVTNRKTAWQWSFGVGYRQNNLDQLNAVLVPGSVNNFDNGYFTTNLGVDAVFHEKWIVGIETNVLFTPNKLADASKEYYFGGGNTLLNLGFRFLNNEKVRLAFNYGVGFDANTLLVQWKNSGILNFNNAVNTPTSTTLNSFNLAQKFSLRADLLLNKKVNTIREIQHALGIEAGYFLSGNNTWSNYEFREIAGPSIDNTGLFVKLVYSIQRRKH
ncbi:MAG: hypothetical protein IPM42_20920 [Saprospiraceae bacterium]|nr:hypothetical protein [Saprospiraceae bacterium]